MSKEETIFNPEFAYDLSFYFDRFALLASGAISASHLLCPMKQEIRPGQPRACSPIPAAGRSQERSTVGRERGGKPPRDTTQPICCKEILFLEWDMEETVFKCSFYNQRAKCWPSSSLSSSFRLHEAILGNINLFPTIELE